MTQAVKPNTSSSTLESVRTLLKLSLSHIYAELVSPLQLG